MRTVVVLFLAGLLTFWFCDSSGARESNEQEKQVSAVLDDFHDAAAKADYNRYFGHFAPNAIFLGTDATERWTVEEFKDYTKARFERGGGWTYRTTSRHVFISNDAKTAWFDELLRNERYGECRGSGVLTKEGRQWKLSQYHLTIPIPNALAREVVSMINKQSK